MKKKTLLTCLLLMPWLIGFSQALTDAQREKAESATKKYFSLLSQYAEQPMGANGLNIRNEIALMFENMYNAPVYNDLQVFKQKTNLGASCTIDDYLLSFGVLNEADNYTFHITYDSIVCHPILEPSYAEGYNDLNALVYVSKRIEGGDISEKLTNVIRYNLNTDKISYIEKASLSTNEEDVKFLLKNHLGYSTAKLNEMASRCYQEQKYKEAYRLYEQAAIRDDMDAQFALANMLYKRQGCEEYGEFATKQMTKFWLKKIHFKYTIAEGVKLHTGIWQPLLDMMSQVFKDEPKFTTQDADEPFNSGLMDYKVPDKNLCGFINIRGEIAIPTIYEFVAPFYEDLTVVEQKGQSFYIDTKGNIAIPQKYKSASPFLNGTAIVMEEDAVNGKSTCFIINKKGEKISEDFDYIGGKESKSEMLMIAKKGNKWGFVNGYGKVKIPFIYDRINVPLRAHSSSSDHIVAVMKDGKWGFADISSSEGRIIVPPQYEMVGLFYFGMAWVNDGTGFFFIDKTGKIVCGKYVMCTSFNAGGLAMVKYKPGNKACLINKRGEIVYYCNVDEKGNLSNIIRKK